MNIKVKLDDNFISVTVSQESDTVKAIVQKHSFKGKYKDIYAVLVHCNELGEAKVIIEVGNKKSSALPYPHTVCLFIITELSKKGGYITIG